MVTCKIIIIDDDQFNVSLLKMIISKYCLYAEIVGEADTVDKAFDEISSKTPDVIFISSMLDEEYVFSLLGKIDIKQIQVVFMVSNENELKWYNPANVVMKPIVLEEVVLAMNKVVREIDKRKLTNLVYQKSNYGGNGYIAIPSFDKIDIVKMNDILFCSAEGKYTSFVVADGKKYLSSRNLGDYETLLDSNLFFRVHHSFIVNMSHVAKINKRDGIYCEMLNGATVPVSKRRQDEFSKFMRLK